MSDHGGEGAKVVPCGPNVRGNDNIYTPSKSTGQASTLPMTHEEMAAAAEREKTKQIGFGAR